jgi:hypothetical protein
MVRLARGFETKALSPVASVMPGCIHLAVFPDCEMPDDHSIARRRRPSANSYKHG